MTPKCPTCGQEVAGPRGRPQQLNDEKVKKLRDKGLSQRAIAAKLGVTEGAIRASLKRKCR